MRTQLPEKRSILYHTHIYSFSNKKYKKKYIYPPVPIEPCSDVLPFQGMDLVTLKFRISESVERNLLTFDDLDNLREWLLK